MRDRQIGWRCVVETRRYKVCASTDLQRRQYEPRGQRGELLRLRRPDDGPRKRRHIGRAGDDEFYAKRMASARDPGNVDGVSHRSERRGLREGKP